MNTPRRTLVGSRTGVRAIAVGLLVAIVAVLAPAPAHALITVVCQVKTTFRIGGDDVRGNTRIQISAGGQSFIVDGGIPGNTVASRTGSFPSCIPNAALTNGFTITSISNPSWPETTDNWDMTGLSIIDPETGREYLRRPGGTLMHRFTGQQPSFRTTAIFVQDLAPFFDHRYAICSGSQIFARFVDPRTTGTPVFTVTMRRSGTSGPSVPATFFGDPFNDWGGSVGGLGVSNTSAAFIAFDARTPDGRTASGVISPGCNPDGI